MTDRIAWIDGAKGMGLILVIIGHLKVPFLSAWVYTFHMPLFFFLSGLFFSREGAFLEFFRKKFKRLVVPYFTLGLGILIFWCLIYLSERRNPEDYVLMLKNFIVQKHFWTVWFLTALFLANLIYYGVVHICNGGLIVSTILSLTLFVAAMLYYRIGGETMPWNIDTAFAAQFFIHIGYVTRRKLINTSGELSVRKKIRIPLFFVLLFLNGLFGFLCVRLSGHSLDMSIGMWGNELCTTLSAMSGIGAVVLLSQYLNHKWLLWLGRNTMVLFAWHSRIVIVGFQMLFSFWGILQGNSMASQCLNAFVLFCLIIIILVPLTNLIKKCRFHWCFGV